MSTLNKGDVLEQTYKIIEEIGSGGGGIVYRAKHLRLQTDVVVKKIKDEVVGKVESRQEADILKKLKHPYLPRVYDFIEREDGVYTVMDFIHGENLDSAVRKHGKYSQKQVKKWAEQLGEALSYLHSQVPPIIHRDIKPANIMLTEGEDICLIDFNISLAMGGTMESAVGISAGYSPPEQYRDPALYAMLTHNYTRQEILSSDGGELTALNGAMNDATEIIAENVTDDDKTVLLAQEPEDDATEILRNEEDATDILHRNDRKMLRAGKETSSECTRFMGKGIDSRSDIYSLGITLYYLLTAITPPTDFDKRISIEDTNAAVSEGFALILDKMMMLSPDQRYQNGMEYLKAIQNCYKLDHRYIVMHRRQTGLQAASMLCLGIGILTVFGGLYQIRKETNSKYIGYIQKAQEVMNLYDYEEADDLLAEARMLSPTRIEAYREEIHSLYLSGSYEECINLAENYINTTPFLMDTEEDKECFGDICYIAGNSYFEMEDFPNALHMFEYALENNSGNGLYYRDLAIVLARLGKIEEAEKQLEKGTELGIAPDSVCMAQGEIAYMKGQLRDAVEDLNQAITATTDMVMKKRAVLLCVEAYKTIGNTAIDEEIALLEQYIGQFQGNGDFVVTEHLAEAYTRKAQEEEEQADTYWQKALSLFQSLYEQGYVTYQLQENIAILYENMDRFDEAEDFLLQMAEQYPERYEILKRLAYLEADVQQMKDNADRDYSQMQIYYEKAKEMYSEKEQDMEMDMLDRMMQELREGGWL